jgi:hypothetical protein
VQNLTSAKEVPYENWWGIRQSKVLWAQSAPIWPADSEFLIEKFLFPLFAKNIYNILISIVKLRISSIL